MSTDLITFYIHPKFWPRGPLPSGPDQPWSGFNFGIYTWTIQTMLRIQRSATPCVLSKSVPDEGIVIAHRECMEVGGERLRSGPRRLLVNLSADLELYPPANLQVVQNPRQAFFYPDCHFIMHWPEPGLRPRDPARGERLQNVAYVGNVKSLAPELLSPEWSLRLANEGLRWIKNTGDFQYDDASSYRIGGAWTDYSQLDVVVAVRRYLPPNAPAAFDHKPASKLLNAWRAGVPAILGHESAFRALRRGPLDFIEVHSVEETYTALRRLRDDADLRRAMVENGFTRIHEVDANATQRRWCAFLDEVAIPTYQRWIALTPAQQRFDENRRRIAFVLARGFKKVRQRWFAISRSR